MIIQQNPQQLQQLAQPLATQVQIRQSLALKQIDQSSSQLISSNQPLSPTHSAISAANRQQQIDQKINTGGRQRELKGVPQIVGLTSIDYQLDAKVNIQLDSIQTPIDPQSHYISQIYQDNAQDCPFTNANESLRPNDHYQQFKINIKLPYMMTLEHFELQISQQNMQLFNKYLRFLKVETLLDNNEGKYQKLHLKSAFLDENKKTLELNTSGVSQDINLVFLYLLKNRPSLKTIMEMTEQKKEKVFSKTQNVSDKIKNEILPLLNGSDEDIDELDDEVAMISNKKGHVEKINNNRLNEVLQTEDIKVEFKNTKSNDQVQNKQQLSKNVQGQTQTVNEEDEETRNFNTLPRNYSDPLAKKITIQNDSSYNDMEFNSQMMEQHLMQNEYTNLQESQNLQIGSQSEIFNFAEHEIFSQNQEISIEIMKLLTKTITNIKITGFNSYQIPAITNITYFINQSCLLKQNKQLDDALEYDYMSGVLMISTKRFTQAVEVFRKIQFQYLLKIDQLQKAQNTPSVKSYTRRLFLKSAIIELLTAESMSQPNQLNEKIQSIQRMIDLFQCKTVQRMTFSPQILASNDPFSAMIKFLPQLLKFTVMCLTHNKEIVRMSALKLLEFILETKGCSLDQAMVFTLKALLKTYPTNCLKGFTQSVHEFFQYEDQEQKDSVLSQHHTKYTSIKEPTSGFQTALKNAQNHALETYISVLSSISSHILHQLFYEVILPIIINPSQDKGLYDVKLFSVKIAEKIITICQGDLFLSKSVLEYFLSSAIPKNQSASQANSLTSTQTPNEAVQTAVRNLWSSIRTKVFTNYSQKGLKILIEWLVDKMSMIAQNSQSNNNTQPLMTDSSVNPDISKLEISDEECQQLLQLFDIVSMISVGRKNNEAEANSLIKIKQEYCLELYVLINPLMFWLDFSVEREERFPLFKAIYSTIKDVLENLPPKRNDIDLLQIMEPILMRTKDFLRNNSPSLQMLKFLEIVLRDIKQLGYCQANLELQSFFLDMLDNFVGYVSYCLHEEVFSVFDKLFALCADTVSEKVLTKCIIALVDKYTIKNRAHKNSLTIFIKNLLEVNVRQHHRNNPSNNTVLDSEEDIDDQISIQSKNNYFEILCEFCFFNNKDPFPLTQSPTLRDDFKSPIDLHDLYIDKMQFFIDILSQLTDIHVNLFAKMISHSQFKSTLLDLLDKGEISLRLKCHEILETVCNYYVLHCPSKTVYRLSSGDSSRNLNSANDVIEVQFINQERLQLSQIVLQCIQYSLEKQNDSYLQFNSLILLDFLFQQMLPVPTYQNELQKDKINKSNGEKIQENEKIFDLQLDDINEHTPEFEVTSSQYTLMRLDLIFKLWPYIQQALNSPWSNIRSICYGLICSMLKIDVKSLASETLPSNALLGQQQVLKLRQLVLPMLQNLLSSRESESKAGGLNILGSFCGLSYDFSKIKISKNIEFFKKNSKFISSQIWQLVFELQDDWDITIKEASVVLIQLCAPRNAVKYYDTIKKDSQEKRFNQILQGYGIGQNAFNTGEQSSRMSSARDHQYLMHHSIASNEDTLQLSQQITNKQNTIISGNTNNMIGYLNNGSDDMSIIFQMEQQQNLQQQLSGTQIFDRIGETITSRIVLNPNIDISEEQKEMIIDQEIIKFESQNQPQQPEDCFEFFVDKYQDDQIQEIISIFRNDFKPPKSLWIEKNQTGNGFNVPDYYAEIFSSAIDQFNQQQMQLQQLQQQQQQLMVNNSPKNSNKISINQSLADALEDDMVKKLEYDRNEKEKKSLSQDTKDPNQKAIVDNYKIFERHYEDGKEEQKVESQQKQEISQVSNFMNLDNSIDAEPYQFLDQSPNKEKEEKPLQTKKSKKSKEDKKKSLPPNHLQLQIADIGELKHFSNQTKSNEIPNHIIQEDTLKQRKKSVKDKRTTDELIEEYEKKISKTKQLLEEEKKKSKNSQNIYETSDKPISDPTIKSTPDFKQKKDCHISHAQPKGYLEDSHSHLQKSNEKKKHAQHYMTEIPKSYQSNLDNAKLMKQINNCFNDNSFNNINIGPVVMTTTIGNTVGTTKNKQKLNKSFENILAASKYNLKQSNESKPHKQKNQSTSPRRASSSGKKSGSVKSGGNNKKKYLDQSQQMNNSKNPPKALYNMRDLNYFIKTIEKDLSDKFNKLNMKDFNSMPTTPTSILKKVEDQMKALATQNLGYSKADVKAQMSNTCPNIAQILSQLDTFGHKNPTSSTNQKLGSNPNVFQISQLKMNAGTDSLKMGGSAVSDIYNSSNLTPSNISNNCGNMIMAQSQNSLSGFSIGNQLDKFSFSKTQKLDLKEATKNMFSYQIPNREGQTARENSNENKRFKPPSINEDALLKQSTKIQRGDQIKRQRGSQEKYLTNNQVNHALINNPNGSLSYSKLNKSLNNISQIAAVATANTKKKEMLSKSMINNFVKANNMSPNNKKQVQQMIKQQMSGAPSQVTTQNNHTPLTTQNLNNQYSYSSNLLYDYIQNSDQGSKKISQNAKTPIKNQGQQKITGKIGNYSEILDISPSSGDKDLRYYSKNLL